MSKFTYDQYEGRKMSAACYEMARRHSEEEKKWTSLAFLWRCNIKEARTHTANSEIEDVCLLYGTHVLATKCLDTNFSRTDADSFEVFSERYSKDPKAVTAEVAKMEDDVLIKIAEQE